MAALKYWVWLTTLPGLTDSSKMLLMEHFSSPEDIYYADEEALWQVDGLKKEQAALLGSKSLAAADRILSDCARKDIFIITMADALYPDRLRNIYQPPLLLYGKGACPSLTKRRRWPWWAPVPARPTASNVPKSWAMS